MCTAEFSGARAQPDSGREGHLVFQGRSGHKPSFMGIRMNLEGSGKLIAKDRLVKPV